jgi:hypothetical protein
MPGREQGLGPGVSRVTTHSGKSQNLLAESSLDAHVSGSVLPLRCAVQARRRVHTNLHFFVASHLYQYASGEPVSSAECDSSTAANRGE